MELSKLPVFNRLRMLYVQFEKSTQKAPINIKRGPIFQIETWLIEMLDNIQLAHESELEMRLICIRENICLLRMVKMKVRTLQWLHIIHDKAYAAIIREEENVAAQLAGWEKSIVREMERLTPGI